MDCSVVGAWQVPTVCESKATETTSNIFVSVNASFRCGYALA